MCDDALRNRLLRRLKSRCNALSKYHTAGTFRKAPVVTYANTQGSATGPSELPPLGVLRPPDNWHSTALLELSKKIYAVRDAFKEIASKTSNATVSAALVTPTRIPKLASLCASIVGRSMEAKEIMSDDNEEVDDEDEDVLDEQFVEQLYDAVPLEYRNSAFISHSVAIILDNCPHHPTLLRLILDVTLDRHLNSESGLLIQELLLVAFAPSTSGVIPIRHPAHGKFLVDLYETWLSSGRATDGFLVALAIAVTASDAPLAWSCKAMSLLLKRLGKTDAFEFTPMACILSETLREMTSDTMLGDSPLEAMESQLCLWLRSVLTLLVGTDDDSVDRRSTYGVLCLSSFLSNQPHVSSQTQSLIASISTRVLSHHRQLLSKPSEIIVVDVLRSIPAQKDAFDTLIRVSLAPLTDPLASITQIRQTVEKYATTIRSEKLLKLEAAFWACALHHTEHVDSNWAVVHAADVQQFHLWLIETVDHTEGRYFQMSMADTPARTAVCRDWSQDEWYWEPMIGEWIQKTPGPASRKSSKRRKLEVGWDSETPRRTSCRSIMLPPNFTKRSFSDTPTANSTRTPLRSTTNFTSLLSRAMAGRTVLHANSPIHNPSDDSPFSALSPYTPAPAPRRGVSFKRPRSPSSDGLVPSSDDLIAYATPCRR